jgi:pre-mRNA-splicing factor SYF2
LCCLPFAQAPEKQGDDSAPGAKYKWYEEKKKRKEEEMARLGITAEEAHRLETAEVGMIP